MIIGGYRNFLRHNLAQSRNLIILKIAPFLSIQIFLTNLDSDIPSIIFIASTVNLHYPAGTPVLLLMIALNTRLPIENGTHQPVLPSRQSKHR